MKNAVIFHGTDCTPDEYWYEWIAEKLRQKGYSVKVPYYPELNHEDISTFLPKVLSHHTFDSQTLLIGHSAGVPLILAILEHIDVQIAQAILVAGFFEPFPEGNDPILQESYDWKKIKNNVREITIINSSNDPWSCTDIVGRSLQDKIGGKLIVKNEGHFGSGTYNQPYPTFELLDELIQ